MIVSTTPTTSNRWTSPRRTPRGRYLCVRITGTATTTDGFGSGPGYHCFFITYFSYGCDVVEDTLFENTYDYTADWCWNENGEASASIVNHVTGTGETIKTWTPFDSIAYDYDGSGLTPWYSIYPSCTYSCEWYDYNETVSYTGWECGWYNYHKNYNYNFHYNHWPLFTVRWSSFVGNVNEYSSGNNDYLIAGFGAPGFTASISQTYDTVNDKIINSNGSASSSPYIGSWWINGGNCFTAGTQVVVGVEFDEHDVFVQYVTKNIEDIQVGDLVYSYDTITGVVEQKEVTAIFVREVTHINYLTVEDEFGNVQILEVTDVHPFWVITDEPDLERAAREYADGAWHYNIAPTENGFWVEAKDLLVGDVFIGINGELSTLMAIERVELEEPILVYNFTVEGNHNYFVIAKDDELGQTCILVHNQSSDPWYKRWFSRKAWSDWYNGGGEDVVDSIPNILGPAVPPGVSEFTGVLQITAEAAKHSEAYILRQINLREEGTPEREYWEGVLERYRAMNRNR